ncbi:Protein of unknown function [Gryllus bimaculatus]|nr:Protein of unknown function [Gryllus bimaculatus]
MELILSLNSVLNTTLKVSCTMTNMPSARMDSPQLFLSGTPTKVLETTGDSPTEIF